MNLKGTEFQIKVWKEISKIPYGKTRTYKQIAEAIGHPKSYRVLLMLVVKIHILKQYHVTEL